MMLPDPELARILRELAMLLHSGVGAADSAFLLAREEQPPLKERMKSLGEALDRGSSLSDAMEAAGGFPDQVRAMVRIGEETGHLEDALNALADFYEQRVRTLRQVRSAVSYPAMVFCLMLLVVGILLVKVMPVFDRVYASLGSRLTGPAAGLLYAGQLLEAALPALAAGLLLPVCGAAALWLRPSLRERAVSVWKRRYGDRGIARKFNNARFARALAMGLSSGMDLENCMTLAENLLGDTPDAVRRCQDCTKAMAAGEPFAAALEKAELLPPSQSRLLQVGIRSGNADRVMDSIADSMLEEARNALEKAVSGIEPVMVLISSLLVGLILLSVMLPLADILSVLG